MDENPFPFPDLKYFERSIKADQIRKPLKDYMMYNNFRMEEIFVVFSILNEVCRQLEIAKERWDKING